MRFNRFQYKIKLIENPCRPDHLQNTELKFLSGFEFTASAHSLGCGGVLHGDHGNISSPVAEGGTKYPNGAECVWEIRSEQGFHVVYDFYQRFDVETAAGCNNDYVQVGFVIDAGQY